MHREPVTRVYGEPQPRAERGRLADGHQCTGAPTRVGVGTRVQLYCIRAQVARALYRVGGRVYEETDMEPRAFQPLDPARQPHRVARNIEPTLGGDLLAPLGYQGNLVGSEPLGYVEHLFGEGHLQVEDRAYPTGQTAHIFVLYMPAILAEVRGYPVGARILAERGRGYRIRFVGAPRLAKRGDMVDVDVETLLACWHSRSKLGSHSTTLGVIHVKRIALLLLVAVACRSAPTHTNPTTGVVQLTGASSPREAVQSFLGAVNSQDLQAMSVIWGTSKGPIRDQLPRAEMEKRELIMQCYLTHDKFDIQSDARTGEGLHKLGVSITKGNLTRETNFITVQGPSERWYVQDVPLEPIRDLCANP